MFWLFLTLVPPAGTSRKEITEHWEWLEHHLLQTLSIFENENDITTFVKGKVQVSHRKKCGEDAPAAPHPSKT